MRPPQHHRQTQNHDDDEMIPGVSARAACAVRSPNVCHITSAQWVCHSPPNSTLCVPRTRCNGRWRTPPLRERLARRRLAIDERVLLRPLVASTLGQHREGERTNAHHVRKMCCLLSTAADAPWSRSRSRRRFTSRTGTRYVSSSAAVDAAGRSHIPVLVEPCLIAPCVSCVWLILMTCASFAEERRLVASINTLFTLVHRPPSILHSRIPYLSAPPHRYLGKRTLRPKRSSNSLIVVLCAGPEAVDLRNRHAAATR